MTKDRILIIGVGGVMSAVFCGLAIWLVFRMNHLKTESARSREFLEMVQKDLDRVQKEKSELQAQQEKLQADAIKYMGTNSSLEAERNRLSALLDEARQKIENKDGDLQSLTASIEKSTDEKMLCPDNGEAGEELKLALMAIEKEKSELEDLIQQERSVYHYNLAVVYTQSNLLSEAIDEYTEALRYNPRNAEAHYNLAVLLEDRKPAEAVQHYQQYLDLLPDALDKMTVFTRLHRLSRDL